NYVGEQITLPYLQKLGIRKLDGVVISHFDTDHCRALPTLMDNMKIDNIYGSYIPEGDIYDKIKDSNIPFKILKSGNIFRMDEDILFNVLWPSNTDGLDDNNKSLVLSLNFKGYDVLLTGDIEEEAELMLLEK